MKAAFGNRRHFLQMAAATGAIAGLGDFSFLGRLRPVSAAEAAIASHMVQFDPDIEPLVRLLEETPREKVIEAFEAGIEIDGPSGKVASHPKTHYCTMDMYLAEVRDSRFQVLESWQQVPPVGEGDDSCNVLSMSL